jgi:filamentous hemagglutinin
VSIGTSDNLAVDGVTLHFDNLKARVLYDRPALLTGRPNSIAVCSQGLDSWGSLFTSDKQIAFAKNLKEGWLTPEEQGSIARWAGETRWLDAQVGCDLTPHERAGLLTELVAAGGMAILARAPGSGTAAARLVPCNRVLPALKLYVRMQQTGEHCATAGMALDTATS